MNESEAPPVEQLAALAGRWAPLLADPAALEAGFRTQQFGRLVELVRSQLGPLHSREALAESYLREAGRHRAVEAAYGCAGSRWATTHPGMTGPLSPGTARGSSW